MRFSANVSILFKEVPFLEQFGRAKEASFSAVEFWWPSGEDLGEVDEAVKEARLGVPCLTLTRGTCLAGTVVS
jgi:hydroxypyruvate isomerase